MLARLTASTANVLPKNNLSKTLPYWATYWFYIYMFLPTIFFVCGFCIHSFPCFGVDQFILNCAKRLPPTMLTVDGINCAFSLPLGQDRVWLKLQVIKIDIIYSDSSASTQQIEVTESDGGFLWGSIGPQCVTNYIRSNFPDSTNVYTGLISNDNAVYVY